MPQQSSASTILKSSDISQGSSLSAAEKLSKLIQYPSISYNDESLYDDSQFRGVLDELERLFPACHRVMSREVFSDYAVNYVWQGKNKDLDPAIVIAHYDVVPVDDESEWNHPPFSGHIDEEGFIWGRGTIDIKNQICAAMEACEKMIEAGFQPERTIYLAWGGDEEVSGKRGAAVLAREFEKRGIRFAFLMDEGGVVSTGQFDMVDKPVALIGVEEKGMLNLKLSCRGTTGHSSMPPRHTAIGILSEAIGRIENNPFPVRLTTSAKGLFTALAPHSKGIHKIIFNHLGLFGRLLMRFLSARDATNAMIRTSQSVTIIKGGYKENVLPDRAECVINFRILPGETIETVKNRIEKVVDNPDITVEIDRGFRPNEPILIRSLDSVFFTNVCDAIGKVFPEAVPAPYLVMGGTDSKNYVDLTDNIFRFSPMQLGKEELKGMHGVNERISTENLEKMVSFYEELFTLSCGEGK
ncbi:MAG: M20/M25/M40 family metallo-hydrolase [Spirochaetales bacterium]|nr:M20/M25/M40 family metallo-hydrolase [Spirochaetales bacterium]